MKLHHKLAGILGYDLVKKDKSHLTLETHLKHLYSPEN